MHIIYERWCASRPPMRVFYWGVATGAFALAMWMLLVQPLHTRHGELTARQRDAAQVSASLWSAIRRYPPISQEEPQAKQPFSPLAFSASGTTLVRWKPSQGGGELTLEADWAQISAVFTRVAQQAVNINAFDILPHEAHLRLHLQLELEHAQ